MATLGISLEKNGLRVIVLDGGKSAPILKYSEKIESRNFSTIPQLMNWYESIFQSLLTKYEPSIVGVKISLNAQKGCIAPWYYPLGLLHYQAFKRDIEIKEFVSMNFTSSKFSLDKSINIYDHVDHIFGEQSPKWDKNQKYAVLAAWMVLV
ncbi:MULTISPECIES: hypothetical protein [Acinetobacter]|uniref:hypothetical protein n=1 Tax=Acinetobacter TaxID=469 RepID=UPI0019029E3E|nr:hypothetical protein [Acinetobacter bereziniae]MBJ8554223.1 hypothetical protein [Acinetobacter bereziniae]